MLLPVVLVLAQNDHKGSDLNKAFNDHKGATTTTDVAGIKAIVTYDYAPHAHFLNLPQRTAPPVVPPLPRSAAQNEAAWAAAAAARAPQAAAA